MKNILQSSWLAGLLGGILYLVTTVLVWKPPPPPPPDAEAETESADPTVQAEPTPLVPSWEFQNPEIEELVKELKKSREEVAQRAAELDELSKRLQAERVELTQVTQKVHQLQVEFDKNVIRIRDEEATNLKKLAKTYATMSPEGAATIFKQLDDASIVKIMMLMKEGETAPVLETMAKAGETEAKRVANLSERLRLALRNTGTAQKGP